MTLITEDLIDHVYEAAAVPELWPAVLDRVAGQVGSVGGAIYVANAQYAGWVASGLAAPFLAAGAAAAAAPRNLRPQRAVALNHAGFISDHDMFTAEEIERDPHYARLRGAGLGWCAGTVIRAPSGDLLILSWERAFRDGPFGTDTIAALDRLRAHLARAALISGRLGLERARAAADTLGTIGLPAAVLSGRHRTVAANGLLERLIPHVVQDRPSRFGLADRRADALLGQSLLQLDRHTAHQVRSIPIAATPQTQAAIAHVVPVRGAGRDIFATAACVLVITAVVHRETAPAVVVQGLFDLTPAEAKVACGVAAGLTVDDIAGEAGCAVGTVRQQLKSVFAKTGVSRQAELVGILAGSAFLRSS